MSHPAPAQVIDIRNRYVTAFPLWHGMPVNTPEQVALAEDRARQWVFGLQQQVVYELPGQGYGSKRADKTRPVTKDGLAQETGGRLYVWDMLSGAGTGSPTLAPIGDAEDITGQIFVPVAGVNILNAAPGAPTQPPVPPPATGIGYDEAKSVEFGKGCNDVYKQVPTVAVDPGMISVFSSRAAYDYYTGRLSWPDSYRRHINEFRAEYGLGPV
jgi:hypothetical protein